MKRRRKHTSLLARLVYSRGSTCEFCGERVRRVSSIPEACRVSMDDKWITHKDYRGKLHMDRVATVEHVKRLCDGGTYHHSNLKLACGECNGKRNTEEQIRHLTSGMLADSG